MLAFALLVALVSGCGGTAYRLTRSAQVPAADGEVNVRSGPNQNSRLKVQVHHLAPPSRVSPGATVYVVWARPLAGTGIAQNVGALQVSKDLTGSLETVTPLKHFELSVTPEPQAAVQTASGPPVLTATVIPTPK